MRNWLIKKLGGHTRQEMNETQTIWSKDYNECYNMLGELRFNLAQACKGKSFIHNGRIIHAAPKRGKDGRFVSGA